MKGLNTSELVLKYLIPNKASRGYHFGRQRGIKYKSTHLEVIVEEIKKVEKKAKESKKNEAKK